MTVTFEDRQALAARAQLLGVLRDEFGAAVTELARAPEGGGPATLRHLERNLFEPDSTAVPPDGSLRLLEGAGDRGEAELIGRKIARLLADGVDPDEIAIAVRSPDRQAPLDRRDPGTPRHPAGPRGERAAGDDGHRLQPVRAARDRRRRGDGGNGRLAASPPGPGTARSGRLARTCGAARADAERRGGALRMGRNRREPTPDLGAGRPARSRRRSRGDRRRADPDRRRRRRAAACPIGAGSLRRAGDRAASRDRGGPGAGGGRRPRRPRSPRAGRAGRAPHPCPRAPVARARPRAG